MCGQIPENIMINLKKKKKKKNKKNIKNNKKKIFLNKYK